MGFRYEKPQSSHDLSWTKKDLKTYRTRNQWSAKTSFVHPEEPYEASLRGLATARLHCRYEMSKILDEVSKINPRILKENIHKTQF